MGNVDLQRVQGFSIGGAAHALIEIDVPGPAKDKPSLIAGRIDSDACAAFGVDPLTASILAITCKHQNMVPADAIAVHEESQIARKQLAFGDRNGISPLTGGANLDADAQSSFIDPVCKTGAIQTIGTDRASGTGACGSNQFRGIPFVIPARCTLTAPEIRHLTNQGQRRGQNVLSRVITVPSLHR